MGVVTPAILYIPVQTQHWYRHLNLPVKNNPYCRNHFLVNIGYFKSRETALSSDSRFKIQIMWQLTHPGCRYLCVRSKYTACVTLNALRINHAQFSYVVSLAVYFLNQVQFIKWSILVFCDSLMLIITTKWVSLQLIVASPPIASPFLKIFGLLPTPHKLDT